jgi:hypothetical protein
MAIRDLRPLAMVVAAMVIIGAAWNPVILTWARIAPVSFSDMILPIASGVDGGRIVFGVATMIVFAIWIYLAGRNLIAAGIDDLDYSAGSRIWWFFVPIAALFKPFQAMRELWNASRYTYPHDTSAPLVNIWWALWLIRQFAGGAFGALANDGNLNATGIWVQSAIQAPAAVAAIMVVWQVSRAQTDLDRSSLAEVFA